MKTKGVLNTGFSADVLLPSAGERGVRPLPLLYLHTTEEETLGLQQDQHLQYKSVTSKYKVTSLTLTLS